MSIYLEKLESIRRTLMSEHRGTSVSPSASKGADREMFVKGYLAEVFPLIFRFGSGCIIDSKGGRSGQVDVVMENPYLPSLPSLMPGSDRMYFAEGVTAAIEVKSNLSSQLGEAVSTTDQVAALSREVLGCSGVGLPAEKIMCIAVGYEGCAKLETARGWIDTHASLDAVLVLDSSIFISRDYAYRGMIWPKMEVAGDGAMWAFIKYLFSCSGNFAIPQDQLQHYPH